MRKILESFNFLLIWIKFLAVHLPNSKFNYANEFYILPNSSSFKSLIKTPSELNSICINNSRTKNDQQMPYSLLEILYFKEIFGQNFFKEKTFSRKSHDFYNNKNFLSSKFKQDQLLTKSARYLYKFLKTCLWI